jgi:hypothetical protein
MKLFVAIILTALLSLLAGLYLPWWSIAIAAFIAVLLIPMKSGRAFLAGFIGVFILWAVLAFMIDVKNQHLLSVKIAEIFPLGGSSIALILVTAFIGALVGGMAALTASFLRKKS